MFVTREFNEIAYLVQCWNSVSYEDVWSKVPAEPDGEPVDDLDNRDKADSKAETAEPSKAGDEVKPRHLGGALKLCK